MMCDTYRHLENTIQTLSSIIFYKQPRFGAACCQHMPKPTFPSKSAFRFLQDFAPKELIKSLFSDSLQNHTKKTRLRPSSCRTCSLSDTPRLSEEPRPNKPSPSPTVQQEYRRPELLLANTYPTGQKKQV
jgi:hypothetical protein